MKIELIIDGKKKSFQFPSFIAGRLVREAVAFTKMDLTNIDEEGLDKMVGYVVNVYGNKFTLDDFYDGIDARHLMDVLGDTILSVVNGTVEAVGGSKNPNK